MTVIPAELLRLDLEASVKPPGGVTIGLPEDELKRLHGYVVIDPAGQAQAENLPLLRQRFNVRCIHENAGMALRLVHVVRDYLHERGRRVVRDSDGRAYLVQRTWVLGGPVEAATPNLDLFAFVLYVDALVGLPPVPDTAPANR